MFAGRQLWLVFASAMLVRLTFSQYAAHKATECQTGARLATALADPEVGSVLLPGDIQLKDSDWDGHKLPIIMRRNITIVGTASRPVTLDMAFIRAKVQFTNGTTVVFRHVALVNFRAGSWNQAPGFDFLAPTPTNETAMIHLDQAAIVNRVCFPLWLAQQSVKVLPARPLELPGVNMYILPEPLPTNCTNSTRAPLLDRCYAYAGRYIDVAGSGFDSQSSGRLIASGYLVYLTDVQALCPSILSDDCIAQLGPIGCVLYTYSRTPPPSTVEVSDGGPPRLHSPAEISGAAGGGSSGNNTEGAGEPAQSKASVTLLAVVLGSVLGGLFLAMIAVLGIILARNGRKKQRQRNQQPFMPTCFIAMKEAAREKGHTDVDCPEGYWSQQSRTGMFGNPHGGYNVADERTGGVSSQQGEGNGMRQPASTCMIPSRQQGGRLPRNAQFTVCNVTSIARFGYLTDDAAGHLGASGPWGNTDEPSTTVITPSTPQRGDLQLEVRLAAGVAAGDNGVDTSNTAVTSTGTEWLTASSSSGTGGEECLGTASTDATGDSTGSGAVYTATSNIVTLLPTVLGKGAFGRVYEGTYRGARVAVKVVLESAFGLHPAMTPAAGLPELSPQHRQQLKEQQDGHSGQEEWREMSAACMEYVSSHKRQFIQEVEVLGRCQHPNVVRLLAACLTPPRMCLVMELMDTSLERLIFGVDRRRGNTLVPLPKLLYIGIHVGQGLEYLHPTIVHRDLKPANVLISGVDTPEPVVKLTDFGLSRLRAATVATMHPDAGTPAYLAPECFDLDNNVVTHRADIYALGVLLWTMLTGRQPWKDHSIVAVAYKVTMLRERLPLENLSDRRCPPKLKQLIRQCWEQDPRRRPAAAEVVKELQVLQQRVQAVGVRRHSQQGSSSLLSRLHAPPASSSPQQLEVTSLSHAKNDTTSCDLISQASSPQSAQFVKTALPLLQATATGCEQLVDSGGGEGIGGRPPSMEGRCQQRRTSLLLRSSSTLSEAALNEQLGDVVLELGPNE